jgi:PUA domain protein
MMLMPKELKLKNRHRLKKKELKKLLKTLFDIFNAQLPIRPDDIELGITDAGFNVIVIQNELLGIIIEDRPFLTLRGILKFRPASRFVTVDMGAIKFVSSGADVMSPGIVDADRNIMPGDLVWIRDEQHHQPLAIGESLISGSEMISSTSGKAVKIFHHIGDELWNFGK